MTVQVRYEVETGWMWEANKHIWRLGAVFGEGAICGSATKFQQTYILPRFTNKTTIEIQRFCFFSFYWIRHIMSGRSIVRCILYDNSHMLSWCFYNALDSRPFTLLFVSIDSKDLEYNYVCVYMHEISVQK